MTFSASIASLVESSNNHLLSKADHWCRRPLAEIASVINGFPFKSEYFGEAGVPLIRIRDVTAGEARTKYSGPIPDGYWVSPGDIVIGMDGDFNCRIWAGERALLNQRVCKVIPDQSKVDKRFLAYVLPGYLQLINQETHSITVKHLSSKTLEEIPLPYPDLTEQRRIVDKLDNLLGRSKSARDELDRVPKLIDRYKQAVLAAAYSEAEAAATGFMTLGEVANEVRNGVSRKPENAPPGVPVLKISAVRPMTVRMDERRYYVLEAGEDVSRYALQSGDLLFTRYNGNPDLVANCAMIRTLDELLIYPDKLIRVRVDPQLADPEFVEALSSSPQARATLAPFIKSAAGQHGISGADLKDLPIPLPSTDQQEEIIARVRRSFSAIERMAAEAAGAPSLLDRLDQATLAKAFGGGLIPYEPGNPARTNATGG